MARQFNLIPPVCDQSEYHMFQRTKIETQMPELYHKIGWSQLHNVNNPNKASNFQIYHTRFTEKHVITVTRKNTEFVYFF